jgi:TRAP-type C4-dicarboxylate transport system substrate-binding protein
MNRALRCAASLGIVVAMLVGLAQAQAPRELKLSTAQGPAFPLGRAGERWAELLNEASGGTFAIRQYPGAVLAGRDPQHEFGALRDGAADLAVGSALAWSAQLPVFGIYVLPWLAAEPAELAALLDSSAVRDGVAASAAGAGVVVVAVAPLGERVLATTKDAVRAPAEMTGLRLRSGANLLVIETLATLGARASAMSLADAQAAFTAGTLDGQEAAASTLAATRISALGQRFVTRWGAFADVMVFAVRKSVWEGWSAEQRTAARDAALRAAREADAPGREEAALAELTKQGVTLVRLAPSQRAALRTAVAPVWAKWTGTIGAELAEAAKGAVARAAATPSR